MNIKIYYKDGSTDTVDSSSATLSGSAVWIDGTLHPNVTRAEIEEA